jgi:RHS repeat-associated protein
MNHPKQSEPRSPVAPTGPDSELGYRGLAIRIGHALILLLLALSVCPALAQTCPPGSGAQELPVQGTWLNVQDLSKCGKFQEFTNVDPCVIRWYLRFTYQTIVSNIESGSATYSSNSLDCAGGGYNWTTAGSAMASTNDTYNAKEVKTFDTNCVVISDIFSGTYSSTISLTGDTRSSGETVCGSCMANSSNLNSSSTSTTMGTLTTGGWAQTNILTTCSTPVYYIDSCGTDLTNGSYGCTTTTNPENASASVDNVTATGPIVYTQTNATTPGFFGDMSGSSVTTYDDEYTDCMLIHLGISQLSAPDAAWDQSVVGAFSDQRTKLAELDWAQFWYTYQAPPGTTCVIKKHYTVISIGCATGWNVDVSDLTVAETVTGDGNSHTETNTMAPLCVGEFVGYLVDGAGILGGKAEITIVILDSVTMQNMSPSASCASCGSGSAAIPGSGQLFLSAETAEADFNLGVSRFAQPAGLLQLIATNPSPTFSTPSALTLLAPTNVATVITNSTTGALRQLGASQCLVDIVTNNAYQYQLVFYPTNALTPGSDGVTLLPTNGLSPLVTWTLANPDGATATNRLQAIEIRGSQQITNLFTWNASSNTWQLDAGNGSSRSFMTETWNAASSNRTEIFQTVNPANGAVLAQTVSLYQIFAWGEGLVQQITGTGLSSLTNTWSYQSGTYLHGNGQTNFAWPVQVVHGDGSWEQYIYDTSGRITQVTAPYGNVPPSASGPFRVTLYKYAPWTSYGDDPTKFPTVPRASSQTLNSTATAFNTFFLASNNMTITVQAPWSANDPFNAQSSSLYTTNWYYPTNDPNSGRLQRTDHPDGTLDLYTYTTNSAGDTNIVFSGVANSGRTAVVDGTETISVFSPVAGQLLSHRTIDVASSLTTSSEIYSSFDDVGRAGLITYLDGTTVQKSYDCCHLNSEIDRDGTTNSYTYDLLKRLVTTTRNGITISNVFDAANNVIQTVRFGTDGSAITNNTSVYDNARRLIASMDALGNNTSYTNFCSGTNLVTETINPDTSTRIQTNYTDGTVAGMSGTAANPMIYFESTRDSCALSTEVKVSATGGTNEWVSTETDEFGHVVKTIYDDPLGTATAYEYYNIFGQLTNTVDPDGVSTIYVYNAKGEQVQTIIDMNRDYTIDYGGGDRITATINDVTNDNSVNVNRMRTWVWPTSGVNASNLVSMAETSVDGLQSWGVLYNNGVGVTNHTQTAYSPTHGYRIVTATAPDGSTTVTTNVYGQLISTTRRDANGAQLSQSIYGWDAHGRQNLTTDARNGTSTNYFNNADQVTATATPSPGAGQSSQVTSNIIDSLGRVIATRLPDNTWVTNDYFAVSTLKRSYGSRTYPVGYSYDAQGRMATLTNWTGFPTTGSRVTAWNYDQYRGYLTGKTYPDSTGPTYDYTYSARLKDRLWARGINTAYTYDNAGELSTVTYNDSTPGVTYGYDRRGRQTSVTVGGTIVTTRAFNDAGNLLSESYSGGPLDGFSVTNGYDTLLRRTNLTVLNPASSVVYRVGYSYDAASRLATVSDGTNTAGYSYVANSPLVSQISFTNAGALRMTTTKTWDYVNRLLSISSANASGGVLDSHGYSYNSANQRTSMTNADGTYWIYGYDTLGQVISGKKYWPDGYPVAGQQFGYAFDNIGNRTSTQSGGDQFGANLLSASYSANNLNQYTSRTVPGFVDILGAATNLATVTVNNYPTIRKESYYRAEIPIANSGGPVYEPVTNLAVLNRGTNSDLIGTNIGNVLVPPASQTFNNDQDGNTTNDSLWAYIWDGENRLVAMTNLSTVPATAQKQLLFTYDDQGRRIQKIVGTWNGSTYDPQSTNILIYDGWNLICELDGASGSVLRNYMWGSDLSGSMQGAGGVGGLLSLSFSRTNCFASYDGNGNVMELLNAADTSVDAQYEYSTFGLPIRATGPVAANNRLGFSTEYQDIETALVYYGRRFYVPSAGRWLSRDPIQEDGGAHLYAFTSNDPIDNVDYLGEWYNGTEYSGHARDSAIWNAAKVYAVGRDWILTVTAMDAADSTNPHNNPLWILNDSQIARIRSTKTYAAYIQNLTLQIHQRFSGYSGDTWYQSAPQDYNFKTYDGKTDPYNAFGNVRFRSEGCVFADAFNITYDATINMDDVYTFAVNGYNRLAWYTPTKVGYNLESHGWIRPFIIEAEWFESITTTK